MFAVVEYICSDNELFEADDSNYDKDKYFFETNSVMAEALK